MVIFVHDKCLPVNNTSARSLTLYGFNGKTIFFNQTVFQSKDPLPNSNQDSMLTILGTVVSRMPLAWETGRGKPSELVDMSK